MSFKSTIFEGFEVIDYFSDGDDNENKYRVKANNPNNISLNNSSTALKGKSSQDQSK
jgi:hypothetical protein